MNALSLTIVLALTSQVHSLSVVPGSPCFDTCNGNNATSQGDIVCTDSDFTTDAGITLSTCLSCLHGSSYRNGFISDSNIFLYYLSSIQQSCLENSDVTSRCSSLCSPLSASFSNLGGRNSFQSPFAYCSANGNAYFNSASDCATCLQSDQGSVILGNVVYVGDLGCQTTPSVQDGEAIVYPGNLFGTTPLGSTSTSTISSSTSRSTTKSTAQSTTSSTTSTTATSTTSSSILPGSVTVVLTATLAFTPSATASATSSSDNTRASALSRGVAAGIGIVLGLIGIAAIIAFSIIARRRLKRKSAAFQRMSSPAMAQAMSPVAAFLPPIPKTSAVSLGTAAASVLAKAGLGTKPKDVEANQAPKHRHSRSFMSITSRSFKSMTSKSWRSRNMTPRTSAWFYAANPKKSSDLTALPQPVIVPGMDGIPEVPPSRGTLGRGWE